MLMLARNELGVLGFGDISIKSVNTDRQANSNIFLIMLDDSIHKPGQTEKNQKSTIRI
jgi:hypothetical protein